MSSDYLTPDLFCEICLLFSLPGYTVDSTQHFIALTKTSNCKQVPKPLTGVYLASVQGYWEGQVNFEYNQAYISFDFNNLLFSNPEFALTLNQFLTTYLIPLGQSMELQNLAQNLILLMSREFHTGYGETQQSVIFTAVPSVVFDRENILSYIASAQLLCPTLSVSYFDIPSSTYVVTFVEETFNEQCIIPTNSSLHAYHYTNLISDGPNVELYLDTRSLVVAMAVNMKYLDFFYLEQVFPSPELSHVLQFNFVYKGIAYEIKEYFLVQYPGMSPIGCIFVNFADTPLFCFAIPERSRLPHFQPLRIKLYRSRVLQLVTNSF